MPSLKITSAYWRLLFIWVEPSFGFSFNDSLNAFYLKGNFGLDQDAISVDPFSIEAPAYSDKGYF
jgi:hypothetical protein